MLVALRAEESPYGLIELPCRYLLVSQFPLGVHAGSQSRPRDMLPTEPGNSQTREMKMSAPYDDSMWRKTYLIVLIRWAATIVRATRDSGDDLLRYRAPGTPKTA